MDAVDVLSHDHRMVEQLFRDYHSAASDAQRRGVVEIVILELSKHAALEELLVYPLAKQVVPDGAREIDRHLGEHMQVKELLAQLDDLGQGDAHTDGLMDQLHAAVAEHVEEEEGQLFPQLRRELDDTALDELGEAITKAKDTAPTRPHPNAPTQPPALALAAPVAAIYDRMRDRLQGRPRT